MDVDPLAREAARLSAADQHALLDRIVDALTGAAERQVAEAWDDPWTPLSDAGKGRG